ncbi:unnamed protein product [Mucor circinelloides]|uniref:Uncharacterized protein n=1 Tax=Mucor circinelloides f. circinelloides (strain 1006PhL) TaxID=1220926 RepID=S2J080_MUCC1|nr:hypothetical protein HMPREF1544_10287 [Mucor circinelloides 1006PhL]KAG1113082.1 hypothetical protein G6F42_014562 [Rhizopus arrhizus]
MSDVQHNNMGPVRPADDEAKAVFREVKQAVVDRLHELKHLDNVHDLHELDDLKTIDFYKLVEYATEEVAYGINYFGKIEIDDDKYIHVRCHKSNDNKIDFYSILTEGTAIWSREEPLKYFID